MQTKPKSNSIITHTAAVTDQGYNEITFTVRGAGQVTVDFEMLHPTIVARAAVHGMIQRISDAAAISRNTENGLAATPADKLLAMEKLVAHYHSGTDQWSRVQSGGPKGGLLFKALCEMYGDDKTPEEIREFLDSLSDKEQAGLRLDSEVAPIIARLKEEEDVKRPAMDVSALKAKLRG